MTKPDKFDELLASLAEATTYEEKRSAVVSHYLLLREGLPKEPTNDEEQTLTILGKNLEKYGIHFNKFLDLDRDQQQRFMYAFETDCQSSLKFLEYIVDK